MTENPISAESAVRLMQGNEACAEGALAAGARFFAGYPITPATEIAELLSRRLPQEGGVYIQMEDELACMGAVVGASMMGEKSMTATSGPGFTLMQENLAFAAMVETPCVVIDVQRGGPATGMPTVPAQADVMQARWGSHGGGYPVIALSPATVAEMYELTVRCFNLAEKYRVPAILLADGMVAHLREDVSLPAVGSIPLAERQGPQGPPGPGYLPYAAGEDGVPYLADFGKGYRFYTSGTLSGESGLPVPQDSQAAEDMFRRWALKMEQGRDEIVEVETEATQGAEVVVVSFGCSSRPAGWAAQEAREQGIACGFFRPRTIWPFPDLELAQAVRKAHTLVVAEMNTGQLAEAASAALFSQGRCINLINVCELGGRLIDPQRILDAVREAVGK